MPTQSQRLELREFDRSYTQAMFDMDNDPNVMEMINGGQPVEWEGYDQKITEFLERLVSWGKLGIWPAHLRDGGEFIGWFALKPDRHFEGEIELGYRLRHEHWGHGYATEGSRLLLDRAFNELKLDVVMAHTLARNVRSQRVMQKLGMSLELEFEYAEHVLPMWDQELRKAIKYSITRDEWLRSSTTSTNR